jgi:hypothetical protein
LGQLFAACRDFSTIRSAYDAAAALEMEYRLPDQWTREQALQDTLRACEEIGLPGLRGAPRFEDTALILDGIGRLRGHLVGGRFDHTAARLAAGRTAVLAACLLNPAAEFDFAGTRYHGDEAEGERLRGITVIHEPWRCLNRLRAISGEAFHYWHIASQLVPQTATPAVLSAKA